MFDGLRSRRRVFSERRWDRNIEIATGTPHDSHRPGADWCAHLFDQLDLAACADAQATPVPGTGDRLNVGFGGLLHLISKADEGNYRVMELADDYSLALVGSPDRETRFMLPRDGDGDAYDSSEAAAMLARAKEQGFDVEKMLVADWDAQTTKPASTR